MTKLVLFHINSLEFKLIWSNKTLFIRMKIPKGLEHFLSCYQCPHYWCLIDSWQRCLREDSLEGKASEMSKLAVVTWAQDWPYGLNNSIFHIMLTCLIFISSDCFGLIVSLCWSFALRFLRDQP